MTLAQRPPAGASAGRGRELVELVAFPLAALEMLVGLALVVTAAGELGGRPAQLLAAGLVLIAAAVATVAGSGMPRRR